MPAGPWVAVSPHCRDSDSAGLGWEQGLCTSTNVPGPHLETHWIRSSRMTVPTRPGQEGMNITAVLSQVTEDQECLGDLELCICALDIGDMEQGVQEKAA